MKNSARKIQHLQPARAEKTFEKVFITPTPEVALVQHFLSNKVAREKLEPTLSSNWNFKAVIMIPSFRRR